MSMLCAVVLLSLCAVAHTQTQNECDLEFCDCAYDSSGSFLRATKSSCIERGFSCIAPTSAPTPADRCCCVYASNRECLPGFLRSRCEAHSGFYCQDDDDDVVGSAVLAPTGSWCSSNSKCLSGFCLSRCCASECPVLEDSNICGVPTQCLSDGSCQYPAAPSYFRSTVCQGTCSGNTLTKHQCDGSGACVPGYRTSNVYTETCVAPSTCSEAGLGSCRLPNGESCTSGGDCLSNSCSGDSRSPGVCEDATARPTDSPTSPTPAPVLGSAGDSCREDSDCQSPLKCVYKRCTAP